MSTDRVSQDRPREGAGPILRLRNISKVFAGQTALMDAQLELLPGAVHGLVGQNGSGKSTLIKILAGYHEPEHGAAGSVDGVPFRFGSPPASYAAGLRFIHQDLGLIDNLSIIDNLALGMGYHTRFWVSMRRARESARRQLERVGLDADVSKAVGTLTAVEKTMLAVARALDPGAGKPRVLVLDEPTTSLSRPEIDRLFTMVHRVAGDGTAVLLVSHSIDEVLGECDTVTVLRDGSVVASRPAAEVTHEELVALIVGRSLDALAGRGTRSTSEPLLRVERLTGDVVSDLSFTVGRGEIVGLAGIADSGRSEVLYLLGGARSWVGGSLELDGDRLTSITPVTAKAHGIAFLASDRHRESAIPTLRARENITLGRASKCTRLGWLRDGSERTDAAKWMADAGVSPADPDRLMTTFSGGNQQKIVLARAFRQDPRLLLIDQPLQGVDIGAKAALCEQLRTAAAGGLSILVASTDAEDLLALCDRVIILHRGQIAAELQGSQISVEAISHHSLLTPATSVLETELA